MTILMIKVVCSGCGKVRLWDNLKGVATTCWECGGTNKINPEVKVKYNGN